MKQSWDHVLVFLWSFQTCCSEVFKQMNSMYNLGKINEGILVRVAFMSMSDEKKIR